MSDTLEEQVAAHSPYGPSAAEGWSNCLDYVNANRGLPDDSGEAAAEGTFAHQISDECFTLGMNAYDFIGQRMKVKDWTFEWGEHDADLLQPGIDRVLEMGGRFFGERRVDISPWTIPGQFGTLDRGILLPDLICIDDLKWGRGVPVSPIRNKQLVLYAIGFYEEVKHLTAATDFLLVIDQPRCSGGGGEWRTTLAELQEIGAWLKQRAHLSSTMVNPPRTASVSACRWCRRKDAPGGCNTYEEWMTNMLGLEFDDLDGDEPPQLAGAMTPERRAYLLEHRATIVKWLERHHDACLADALEGKPTGGLKAVVDGRKGRRDKWNDEEAVAAALVPILGDSSFTKKLITPTQACKQVSTEDKAALQPLIERGVKGHSLVPEEDARPAVIVASADDFDELEGTD